MDGTITKLDGYISGELSTQDMQLSGTLSQTKEVSGSISVPQEGTKNYNELNNKPKINAVTVEGDKISSDYRLQDKMNELTVQEIEKILYVD